jgi:hypothetical protein
VKKWSLKLGNGLNKINLLTIALPLSFTKKVRELALSFYPNTKILSES